MERVAAGTQHREHEGETCASEAFATFLEEGLAFWEESLDFGLITSVNVKRRNTTNGERIEWAFYITDKGYA